MTAQEYRDALVKVVRELCDAIDEFRAVRAGMPTSSNLQDSAARLLSAYGSGRAILAVVDLAAIPPDVEATREVGGGR